MSDLTGERPTGAGCARTRAALLRERRGTLRLVGEASLLIGAAASATALVAGSANAPSPGFVVSCMALGAAALAAARVRALRTLTPALSLGATALLLAVVALELLRSGDRATALAAASTVAVLPILALQVASTWRRALGVAGAGTCIVATALGAGLPSTRLVPLAAALAAATGIVLAGARRLLASAARRERGDAMRQRAATLGRARDGAQETLANLSHDMRNPLAIAVGFAEMACDAELTPDERAQALGGVRRTLWEISQLVENMLDGSADEAGALRPTCEPVSLDSLCCEALVATQILVRGRPIVLLGSIEPGLVVLADRHGLGRVLGNLLGNAAKYTERGEIRLYAARRGDAAVIRVSDTGPGIASDLVPFIFDRYRRAHEGGHGAGLGLAIARRLTERMGGSLEVESSLGAGSTFSVTLPRAPADRAGAVTHVAA